MLNESVNRLLTEVRGLENNVQSNAKSLVELRNNTKNNCDSIKRLEDLMKQEVLELHKAIEKISKYADAQNSLSETLRDLHIEQQKQFQEQLKEIKEGLHINVSSRTLAKILAGVGITVGGFLAAYTHSNDILVFFELF